MKFHGNLAARDFINNNYVGTPRLNKATLNMCMCCPNIRKHLLGKHLTQWSPLSPINGKKLGHRSAVQEKIISNRRGANTNDVDRVQTLKPPWTEFLMGICKSWSSSKKLDQLVLVGQLVDSIWLDPRNSVF